MTTMPMPLATETYTDQDAIRTQVENTVAELMSSLPDQRNLTSDQKRGIIARYSAVLEGNFIYWMTATLLAVKAEPARPIILDNLHEEVRDAHPAMMRRFAVAANAYPTDGDALSVDADLTRMRLFLGRLSGVQSLVTMAFFEGFIQQFMAYLADLAQARGSNEMEYTDVHGVCDIAHTNGLFEALRAEMGRNPIDREVDLFEGVHLLRALIQQIVWNGDHAASA